ncbi:hypothetical protein PHYSODRAFT_473805, partial [Phytophthora sojae]
AFVRVVSARTEENFNFRLRELYLLPPVEAAYVSDVWLDIWKYRIVRCWTDKVMDFGMHATSQVALCVTRVREQRQWPCVRSKK